MILYYLWKEKRREDSSHKKIRNKINEAKIGFAVTFHKLSLSNIKHLCLKYSYTIHFQRRLTFLNTSKLA